MTHLTSLSTPRGSRPVCLALLLFSLAAAAPAQGDTRRWQGDGGNDLFSNPANWEGDVVPVSGDDVVFPATAVNATATNDLTLALVGISFEKAFTLAGNLTELGAGGIQIALPESNDVLINVPLRLTADQTWRTENLLVEHAQPLDLNGHTVTFDVEHHLGFVNLSGAIGGTGALAKLGIGLLQLLGNNSYAGTTTVNEGYLIVRHVNGLGVGDGTPENGTVVNSTDVMSGTLQFDSVSSANEAIVVHGTGQSNNGSLQGIGAAVVSLGGPVTLATDMVAVSDEPTTLRFDGVISGPGRLGLQLDGTFVLANGGNTFAGGVAMSNSFEPKLVVAATNAIPNAPLQTVPESNHLTVDNVTQTFAGLEGGGLVVLPTPSSEITLIGGDQAAFSGALTGNGIVRQAGTGNQRFGSFNGFTGAVIVDQGAVTVWGLLPASFDVKGNGRLTLAGTPVVGAIVVNGGRLQLSWNFTVTASEAAATQLTMTPGARLTVESGAPGQLGRLTVNGPVSLDNAVFDLPLSGGFAAALGSTFTVIDNDGNDAIAGTFAGLPEGATVTTDGGTFQISYAGGSGNDVVLTLTEIVRTYLLSEGATGSFFDTDILVANPNAAAAPIRITFLGPGGAVTELTDTVPAMSRKTIAVEDVMSPGASEVSTVVRSLSGLPLVVERTMSWDQQGYGAHTERASDGAALTWYFAEGAQGYFHTYLLLANPQETENLATVEYLREGRSPIVRTYPMLPSARRTIDLGGETGLPGETFGMVVTFAQPGLAERAMYFGTEPMWTGGHASAGVTSPSSTSFLAEGATGSFFETFILLANPNDDPVEATLTCLRQGDTPIEVVRTIPGRRRLTLNLEQLDPGLANAAVSTRIDATLPIVVERAQYWPDAGWYEAHNSPAVSTPGTRWGLAEGRVGGPAEYQTYILLANPNGVAAQVSIAFLREDGAPVTKTFEVPPMQRFTVSVGPGSAVPELANERFGALITSDQPILVERAMYANALGQFWAAGTSANGTPLP